jgi:hypothetical protein
LAILFVVVLATGLILFLGIVTAASASGPDTGPLSLSELRQQMVAQQPTSKVGSAGTALAEPPTDPELEREPITETQYDVTRRRFFNRAIYAVFGLFLAQFALASLAFVWPKLKGGFGAVFNAGNFAVSTNEAGELTIDTGSIVQTARSKTYTADSPEGPFCV